MPVSGLRLELISVITIRKTMNKMQIRLRAIRSLMAVLLATFVASSLFAEMVVEETFPVLKTKAGTFTNATVTTKAKDYIFVLHSTGMANIKIKDLPDDVQEQLGYKVADKPSTGGKITAIASQAIPNFDKKIGPLEATWEHHYQQILRSHPITPMMGYFLLGVFLFAYLFGCYCCQLICTKAGSEPGILVWIPGLQMIPLFHAAGMSRWWYLALFVPVLNIVAQILWCVNIAKARGKSGWVALLLILPVTNLPAFLYLAFSAGHKVEEGPAYKSMALQTA